MLLRGCLLRMEAPLFDFFFIFSFLGVKQKQSHFRRILSLGRIFCHAGTKGRAERGGGWRRSLRCEGLFASRKRRRKGGLGGIKSPHHVTTIATANLPFPSCKRLLLSPYFLLPTSSSSSCRPSLTLSAQSFSAQQPQRNEASKSVPFPATEKQEREGREERGGARKERGGGGRCPNPRERFPYTYNGCARWTIVDLEF